MRWEQEGREQKTGKGNSKSDARGSFRLRSG